MAAHRASIQIMSNYISSALELAITSAQRVEHMSIQLKQENGPNPSPAAPKQQ